MTVHLRLPTYFCAPNFAFLMVADAYDALAAVPGAGRVEVVLDDHFASEQINAGVAARAGFVSAFAGEAVAELDDLRAGFVRTRGAGRHRPGLPAAGPRRPRRRGDDPGRRADSPELESLRARRREIGLPASDDAPLVVDVETGAAVPPGDLRLHLGKARLSRVNIEANSGICRGMLAHRYPAPSEQETP